MDTIQNTIIDTANALSTHHYLPLTPIAILIGITCLIAQISLTLLLDKRIFPQKWHGPWNDLPGFTAHQLIALPLMCILTYYGMRDWYFDPNKEVVGNETSYDRVFGRTNMGDVPLAIGSGAILIWDTPTSLFVPALHDQLMLFHHVGMFLVASTMSGAYSGGKMIGYYYACYYFGVIEISSIPLSYVDLFHPKHKYYFEWLNNGKKSANRPVMKIVHGLNEFSRIAFAIAFLIFRGVYFPYVAFQSTVPDLWYAYHDEMKALPDGVPMWTGYFLICFVSLFALLQCFWGTLILKQIYKMMVPGDDDKKKKSN